LENPQSEDEVLIVKHNAKFIFRPGFRGNPVFRRTMTNILG
jgi:hypothetical protein